MSQQCPLPVRKPPEQLQLPQRPQAQASPQVAGRQRKCNKTNLSKLLPGNKTVSEIKAGKDSPV
jgi:hypothetical protein